MLTEKTLPVSNLKPKKSFLSVTPFVLGLMFSLMSNLSVRPDWSALSAETPPAALPQAVTVAGPVKALSASESEVALRKLLKNPYYSREAHPDFPDMPPLSERLYDLPPIVLAQLIEWDTLEYNSEAWTPERKCQMQAALNQLPPKLILALTEHLHGIYLVSSNFKGMGFCEFTLDQKLNLYNFLILNVAVFDKNIDAFLTDKVRSNFLKDDPHHARVTTGTSLSGLYAILLHETMHVIDYQNVIGPSVEECHQWWVTYQNKKPSLGNWWDLYKNILPLSFRTNITFYGLSNGPKMKTSEMLADYRELAQFPLSSLYAAKLVVEDWAELGLFYDILQHGGSDYHVDIMNGDNVEFAWRPQDHPLLKARLDDAAKWVSRSP